MSIYGGERSIDTFHLSPAASLNLGQSQNGVIGNGLKFCHLAESKQLTASFCLLRDKDVYNDMCSPFNPFPNDKF